jgi:drug/metabolite transporter (DMT)-like permease
LLPISLAGQLSIFETIFGVLFVYALKEHIPPAIECLGIGLLLSGTAYGIHLFSKKEALSSH